MSNPPSSVVRVTSNTHRAVDLIVWVCAVAAAIVAVSGGASFLFGNGLLTLKYVLFYIGFLLFGLGSFGIQPKRPSKDTKRITVESDSAWGFEERLHDLPPLRDLQIPVEDRVSRDVKVFVTSLVVLGVSLVLELFAGVSV